MRTLCVAIITVALLAGSTIGVTAQSEDEAPTFTFVTGEVMKDSSPQDDWAKAWMDGSVVHVLGWRVGQHTGHVLRLGGIARAAVRRDDGRTSRGPCGGRSQPFITTDDMDRPRGHFRGR